MNVCLLCRRYFPHIGGIETSIYQLSKAFVEMGNSVTIVTCSPEPQNNRNEYAIVKYCKSIGKIYSIFPHLYFYKMKKNICIELSNLEVKPNLIVARDSLMCCVARRIYRDVPIVYISSMDVKKYKKIRKDSKNGLKNTILRLLANLSMNLEIKKQEEALYSSDSNIVFCQNMKRQLLDSYNKKEYPISVCYPGCTFEIMNVRKKQQSSELRLLFVGRVSPEKNLLMLFKSLKKTKVAIRLTIVGEGPDLAILKEEALQLPSNITVCFEGFQTDLIGYYQSADFFVFPSKYESFGQVIIEAYSCGVPVIGFKTIEGITLTAVDELVVDEVTGFICSEFSEQEFYACIEKANIIKSDTLKMELMQQSCINYAKEKCSWKKLAEHCMIELRSDK